MFIPSQAPHKPLNYLHNHNYYQSYNIKHVIKYTITQFLYITHSRIINITKHHETTRNWATSVRRLANHTQLPSSS